MVLALARLNTGKEVDCIEGWAWFASPKMKKLFDIRWLRWQIGIEGKRRGNYRCANGQLLQRVCGYQG